MIRWTVPPLRLRSGVGHLADDHRGSIAVWFAVGLLTVATLTLGLIDLASAVSQRSKVQDVLDAAALAGAGLYAAGSPDDGTVVARVRTFLARSSTGIPDLASAAVTPDGTRKTVSIAYSGQAVGMVATNLINYAMPVRAHSKAGLGGAQPYPVCILITEPVDNHTLRVSNSSKVTLRHCVVQVNTSNWDAVEAHDNSYIHIVDGKNCFVGNIHFGEVEPHKEDRCEGLDDPFQALGAPPSALCDFTNLGVDPDADYSALSDPSGKGKAKAKGGADKAGPGKAGPGKGGGGGGGGGGAVSVAPSHLNPGTYCGGLTVTQTTTFAPGIYQITGGPLVIDTANGDITAKGVTFLLNGDDAGVEIIAARSLEFSPDLSGGAFSGFVFFLDQGKSTNPLPASSWSVTDMTLSGMIYLKSQQLLINKGDVTITDGAIVADYLLPQGGDLDFTGKLNSTTPAVGSLEKTFTSLTPVLME